MVRAPCCEKVGLKRGPWTPEEDRILTSYIQHHGHGNWRALPKQAGLLRCGKSCRLRWINYLRPDIKRGNFSLEEEETIIELHQMLGNRWSAIAARLPGRTDNEIKNVWHTHLKKRLVKTSSHRNVVVQESKKRQSKEEPQEVVVEDMSNSKEVNGANENENENELCENFWSEVFSSSDDQSPVPQIDDFQLQESCESGQHGFGSNMYTCDNDIDIDIWHDMLTRGGEFLSELLY